MKRLCSILVLLCCSSVLALADQAFAAETIPPVPTKYFNDYANVVSSSTAERLNHKLEDFERESSNQILVVIYPTMQSSSSIEEYTVRVFRAWKPGLKQTNNGAILFVFVNDHRMRIATGYGLEGALPDATCKQILDNEITPHFRNGDYDAGLTAGVDAMLAAAVGEYQGTGQTVDDIHDSGRGGSGGNLNAILFYIFLFILITIISRHRRYGYGGWFYGGGGWGGSGWGGGGGGFGGGGFSGGGGSTGGGGASGSW